MKKYSIECVGKSSIKTPVTNVRAKSAKDALADFAMNYPSCQQHVYDNFIAEEV